MSDLRTNIFFVSGSIGHKNAQGGEEPGMTVFGGDTLVSGNLLAHRTLAIGTRLPTEYSKTTLTLVHNYASAIGGAYTNTLTSDGDGGGEVILFGSGQAGSAGQLHFLHTDGSWDLVQANSASTGATQWLGIPIGASPLQGVLLNGILRLPNAAIQGTARIGQPIYASEVAGSFDFTAPSASSHFVRILGYCIDIDAGSSSILIYFKPDTTAQIIS